MPKVVKPTVLIILDGWGIAPPSKGNPLSVANTEYIDSLIDRYPTMTLHASGEAVGLPWGEMGNSEVGHLNLGAGKIVYQDLPRISRSVTDGSFFENEAFLQAANHARKRKSTLHLIGLLSAGGVHSSLEHLFALLEFCKKQKLSRVAIHAILDGRDAPRQSGVNFVQKLNTKIKQVKVGKIATLVGRYYAMDRDNRWDREEKAYRAMVDGVGDRVDANPLHAIEKSYAQQNFDEEFLPTVIQEGGKPVATVQDGDAVIFFNFRPDRSRQLTKAFILPGFEKFPRATYMRNLFFVTMTEYDRDLPVIVAFKPQYIEQPLAWVIAQAKIAQLHIAETEKYAHVTYFLNGGREKPFDDQDNVLIPSPSVSSYDQKPEMGAYEITDRLIKEMKKGKYGFIVVNFANPDMVAHTGNIQATLKAIEVVDECVGQIVDATLQFDGIAFITSDHGNAEELLNVQTGVMDKEHSVNPVPFIAVSKDLEGVTPFKDMIMAHDLSLLQPAGVLSDVTVTILEKMHLPKPPEMTGQPLLAN